MSGKLIKIFSRIYDSLYNTFYLKLKISMCGIFGIFNNKSINFDKKNLSKLAALSEQRGKDSSGIVSYKDNQYTVEKSSEPITKLIKRNKNISSNFIIGHSRLITNGLIDDQPICRDRIVTIHNGIIINTNELWEELDDKPKLSIDTEVIPAIYSKFINKKLNLDEISEIILEKCIGTLACAVLIPEFGKIILISNNGSLYIGKKNDSYIFASELYFLKKLYCNNIKQIKNSYLIYDVPKTKNILSKENLDANKKDIIPNLGIINSDEDKILKYKKHNLKRCSKCVLPETMPFISFDDKGVCNYCKNYKLRNKPKPIEELFGLLDKYKYKKPENCIIPFSGGRDSCFGLHLIVKELKMKPITYTYDWGMITDLGRRNISRMSSILNVENIIVAADLIKKRRNITKNFTAWLKSPHLGMVSILTAGDKHFFRHIETVKKQTGINLNIWSVNPLEVTYFKSGFLGIPPDFEEKLVYSNGVFKQLRYQYLRFKEMSRNVGYVNRSIFDTLSGEYYRSFQKKSDYYHLYDYWRWDENEINQTLIDSYDWEQAPDTSTTWRIGDGTAAMYNYIYYTVAGFTEHDTFRSNQIREGDLTRDEALKLVEEENKPRYPNLKWYTDCINLDFNEVIKTINKIPSKY